jgi:tetratricopeptide (TPR) repeat protein
MDIDSVTGPGDGRDHGSKRGAPLSPRAIRTPLEDELTAAVEQARASYRDGRRGEAITLAAEVEQAVSRGRSQRQAAIGGAAAVVAGLCERDDGNDDLARQAFRRAVGTLRRAPTLVAERGDCAADLGIALAALIDPGPDAEPDADAAAAEAEGLLRHAMELGETTPDVRRGLAVTLRSRGQLDEAAALLRTSLDRSPRDWQAAAELARTLAASGAPDGDVADAWATAALATVEFGPAWRAAAMFDLAHVDASADPDLLTAAGRAWSLDRRYDDAIRALERAIELDDDHVQAWIELGRARLAGGDPGRSLATYREALDRDPDALDALLGFTDVALLYLGQPDLLEEAERRARRAIAVAPEEPAGYVALGEALRLLRRYEEAAEFLGAGIALLAPEAGLLAFARGTRGQVRLALGDRAGGISDLEAAAELSPGLYWIQLEVGAAHLAAYRAGAGADGEDGSAHLASAMDHLRTAIELRPDNVDAAVNLADAQFSSDDQAAAEQTLLAVLAAVPDSAEAYRALGVVRYLGGRYEDALASVEQATQLADNVELHVLKGKVLTALGRAPEAMASLERAAKLAPEDPEALEWLGEVERTLGRLPEAIAHLSEALRLRPDDGWALASRGAAYLDRGENESAVRDLCAALDEGEVTDFLLTTLGDVPADPELSAPLLAACERALGRAPGEVALRANLGIVYVNLIATAASGSPLQVGYIESACKHLGLAAEAWSTNPTIQVTLAATLFLRGDAEGARKALRAALPLESAADVLARTALLLLQLQHYDEALEVADHALATGDDFAPARIVRGKALSALGRFADAELALAAVPEDQRDADTWATLGEARRMTDQAEQAVQDLMQADRIAPGDAWTLASLGAAQLACGEKEPAVASLRRAVELAPGSLFAVNQLRIALGELGRSAEAVALLKAAASEVPENADVAIEYATALGVAGHHRQALAVLDDVLLRDPDNVVGLRVAGWLLTLLGRKSDAVASYSQAAELTPHDPAVLAELADALQGNGQPAEALAALDRAAAGGETADVAAVRSRLFAALALWEVAVAAAERAVALDPRNYAALAALGWAIAHHSPVDAARMTDVFRDAATAPGAEAAWARRELGRALLLLGRADEAREELLRALDLLDGRPPYDFDSLWARGWCLYLLGRHSEAAEAYSQAEPGLDSPLGLLLDSGLNALSAGDEPKARAEYERAISLTARNPAPLMRGMVASGIRDIGDAIELRWVAEGPVTTELVRSLSAALEACPLPPGISGAV